jgi:hypothetical protein
LEPSVEFSALKKFHNVTQLLAGLNKEFEKKKAFENIPDRLTI